MQRLDQALLPQIAVSAVRQGVGVQFATDPLRRPAGATSAEQARGPADAILEGAQRRPATPSWRMGRHCRTLPRRPAHGDHPGDLAPRRSHRTQTPCRNRSGTPQAHPLGSRRERSRIQYAEAQRVRHFEAQEAAWCHATRPTQHLSAVRTIAPAMPPGQTRTRVAGRGSVVQSGVTRESQTPWTPSRHRIPKTGHTCPHRTGWTALDGFYDMCQVVPSEGPRMRTGASSGPSKRYWRAGVFVSLTAPR